MDLTLFFRVVWRYRLLVAAGLLIAVLAAFMTLVRVDPGGSPPLSLRGEELWGSTTTVFVTQPGFPWGRLPEQAAEGAPAQTPENAGRLAGLATVYSKLADSDPIRDLMLKSLPEDGWEVKAVPLLDDSGISSPLPLLEIAGIAPTPSSAETTAAAATRALQTYVNDRQVENNIPTSDRVVLQRIKGPEEAEVLAGRSFSVPIVAFLVITMITLALPFLLDNIRRSQDEFRRGGLRPEDDPLAAALLSPPVNRGDDYELARNELDEESGRTTRLRERRR